MAEDITQAIPVITPRMLGDVPTPGHQHLSDQSDGPEVGLNELFDVRPEDAAEFFQPTIYPKDGPVYQTFPPRIYDTRTPARKVVDSVVRTGRRVADTRVGGLVRGAYRRAANNAQWWYHDYRAWRGADLTERSYLRPETLPPRRMPASLARLSERWQASLGRRWQARPEATVRTELFSRAAPEGTYVARHARTDDERAVQSSGYQARHRAPGLAGKALESTRTGLRLTGIEYGVTAGAQYLAESGRAIRDLATLARIGAYMARVRAHEGAEHIAQTLGERWEQIKERVVEHAGQRAWPNKTGMKHIISSTAVLAGGVTFRGAKRAARAAGVRTGRALQKASSWFPQEEPAES